MEHGVKGHSQGDHEGCVHVRRHSESIVVIAREEPNHVLHQALALHPRDDMMAMAYLHVENWTNTYAFAAMTIMKGIALSTSKASTQPGAE